MYTIIFIFLKFPSTKNICLQWHFSFETHGCSFCKGWKWKNSEKDEHATGKRWQLTSILAFIPTLTDICLLTYREMHLLYHRWRRRLMIVRPSGSHCFLLMGSLHTTYMPSLPLCWLCICNERKEQLPTQVDILWRPGHTVRGQFSFYWCAKIQTGQDNDPRVASKWS